jgi:glycosyltransferase involved in cell wall biosynthesis
MTSADIALPVYNEERQLTKSITQLVRFIKKSDLPYDIRVVIVNNASTDTTAKVGKSLANIYENVDYLGIPEKGRGRALIACWEKSRAQILAYMDVDLSADLKHLRDLLDAIAVKGADIAIGSRLAPGASVSGRTFAREIISRGYNLLIRLLFQGTFKDAQCGFKAISREAFELLAPLLKNRNWFFDSEMLIIAMKAGFTIEEIPISWKDDPTSTVKVARTAKEDILGLFRLLRTKPWKGLEKKRSR